MTNECADWYAPLADRASLGRRGRRPGSLAGLHEARKANLGQFFTPEPVARFMWGLAAPAIDRALADAPDWARVAVLDNAIGTGRLVRFCDPAKHFIGGVDPHDPSVHALAGALEVAGFDHEVMAGGMESISPSGFAVGLINPPFSLPLQSPFLTPYPGTSFGRFGPNTGAVSHEYALHQALDACAVVVALVSRSHAERVLENDAGEGRLVAVFHGPGGSFREEGTGVGVSVLAFGNGPRSDPAPLVRALADWDPPPDLGLACHTTARERPRLNCRHLVDEKPSITLPVTGINRVRVCFDGRRIRLGFECGLTQAKVMNSVLRESVDRYCGLEHRYPRGVRFTGQGRLDIEVHLAQDDPPASLSGLFDEVRRAGGEPDVDPGLLSHVRRRARQDAIARTPYRRTVWVEGTGGGKGGAFVARARRAHSVVAGVWGAPVIRSGQEIEFTRQGEWFRAAVEGRAYEITAEQLNERFEGMPSDTDGETGRWEVLHEGRSVAFPALAHAQRRRAVRLGLDRWLWDYQLDDLIEASLGRLGGGVSWQMGLGKARLALALCLISGCDRNLVVVDAALVPEMVGELGKLPVPADGWQVIRSPRDLRTLKPINLISYQRLRSPLHPAHPRRTYARMLRRRIGVLVADEGDLIKHTETRQSRALRAVSAKKRYILTGSPIDYPRDILPQLRFVAGNGTALQPYGDAFLEPRLADSMAYARRGIDAFREKFVVLEWVTNEFAEDMQSGAKREIPAINHLPEYRKLLAPLVKRRLSSEPEVAGFARIPEPETVTTELEWDEAHLHHYLTVAEEFRQWYLRARDEAKRGGNTLNLVAILARLKAVQFACNYPQRPSEFRSHPKLTSKQRYAVDRLESLSRAGHKTLLFADNPGNLALLGGELARRDIGHLRFTGDTPIQERTRRLREEFREGASPVLLASFGVARRGLNIPEADRVILFNRLWSAREESQAIHRALRPGQTKTVVVERLHLAGSIDLYQDQMCAHKADAARAGLDYAAPAMAEASFDHLDTILGRFCESLSEMRGIGRHELKGVLRAA